MFNSLREISVLNRIFNLEGSEWPRILCAWLMKFLYRCGFVIGWTVLVAMFVSNYGIDALPYLFVLTALFTVIGSVFYATLLSNYPRENILLSTIFISGFLLILSLLFSSSLVLFFAILIVTVAVFLNQLRIILGGYTEEMFSPSESARTFPIIEAADTVAGIIGGGLIFFLSDSINTLKFIYLWIGALFLIVPIMLYYQARKDRFLLSSGIEINLREKRSDVLKAFKEGFSDLRNKNFIKGLILIVFLQWLIFNLLEFQYTKIVYQNVSNVILEAGSGFEHVFVHDLGILFVLFSFSALLVQLFLGSRVINYIGVTGSIILHALVSFLSFVGLALSFSFPMAILAKNNFTMTNVIHTNAYHSCYYAIKENLREHVREFLEGIVRPVGSIVGSFFLIILAGLFRGGDLIFLVNILLITVSFLFLLVSYFQQKKYTKLTLNDFLHSKDSKVRINALDLLAQKGHKDISIFLVRALTDKNESVSIKVKLLRTIAELQPEEAVRAVINCLNSSSSHLREFALDTLRSYKIFAHDGNHMMLKYELIEALKELYEKEKNEQILVKIILLMSFVSSGATMEFLLKILTDKKLKNKAEAISALSGYDDEEILNFLRSYLCCSNPKERIHAAMVFIKFKKFRHEGLKIVNEFLTSGKPLEVSYSIFAIGELRLKEKRKICLEYLNAKNLELKLQSAIALTKMGYREGFAILIDFLFSRSEALRNKTRFLLKNVDVRIYRNLDKIIEEVVVKKIEKFLGENLFTDLKDLNAKNLMHLRWLYTLIEEFEEVEKIENILKFNNISYETKS